MSETDIGRDGDFWGGFSRLADPKISLTSLASIYLGAAVASVEGGLHWGWLIATAITVFALEAAKNATGDIYDYDSGTDLRVAPEDRTPFSGGKRVLVEDLLTRRQTWEIAIAMTALAGLLGIFIVVAREPAVLWFGLAGALLGWSYQGPPLKLSYRGGGEAAVMVVYGPLIALATYLIQTHQLSAEVFLLSLPLGLIVAAFLWVNEFPDYEADKASGKRNLVVQLGKEKASQVLPAIYLAAALILLALPAAGLPKAVWLGALFLPAAAYASFAIWREPQTFHRKRPAQPAALVAFLLYSVGAGTGVLIG
ncbi:prenyltransferase [Afifella pfennigii]|uniref:prenyltransferase n=1 Tax=Afifella pfennigii TaxID=209897 RepID=UPI0006903941|nr:prenyltransferase [Afifella pfennigii]